MSAALGPAIGSAVYAKRARQEIEKKGAILESQLKANRNIFDKQYYQDILDRTEVQDILNRIQENQKIERERDNAVAAVTGASTEQRLAQEDSRNKSFADAAAQIASNASMLKDSYLNNWQAQLNNYFAGRLGMQNEFAGINDNRSAQLSMASQNLFTTSAPILAKGINSLATKGASSAASAGGASAGGASAGG